MIELTLKRVSAADKGGNMKKLLMIIVVLFISMAVLNAVPEYEDVKSYLDKQVKLFEDFGKECEGVKDAKSAAAALNGFTEGFKVLVPEIKVLSAKYKNMKEMMKENTPPELAPYAKKLEEVSKSMGTSMMKLMQYAQDPEVMKAQQGLQALMMEISKMSQDQGKEEKK